MLDDRAGWRVESLCVLQEHRLLWSADPAAAPQLGRLAVMSARQVCGNPVNDAVAVTGAQVSSVRPVGYGRAALVNLSRPTVVLDWDLQADCIIDIKGCGVADDSDPAPAHHRTGLLTLAEAVHEVLAESLVARAIRRFELPLGTVACLGIIQTDVRGQCRPEYGFAGPQDCALLLRAAHPRPADHLISATDRDGIAAMLALELHLRLIGLTSTKRAYSFRLVRAPEGHLQVTRVSQTFPVGTDDPAFARMQRCLAMGASATAVYPNVQLTLPDGPSGHRCIIDFGHFNFADDLTDPLVLRLRDLPHEWGPCLLPTDPGWQAPTLARALFRQALRLPEKAATACHNRYGLSVQARQRIGWFDTLCLDLATRLSASADPQYLLAAELERQAAALEEAMDAVTGS